MTMSTARARAEEKQIKKNNNNNDNNKDTFKCAIYPKGS